MKKRKLQRLAFLRMPLAAAGLAAIAVPAIVARADSSTVTAPSVYRTIDVTGDPSQFSDIQAAATNSTTDSNALVDPVSLKIVNDSNKLYLLINYTPAANPNSGAEQPPGPSNLYLAIDSDNDPTTAYHVYGSPDIGSNAGFQNDYPFTQSGSSTVQNFNSGGSLTSESSAAAGTNFYLASNFDAVTSYQMISLPLDLTEVDGSTGGYNGLVFPQGTPFSIEVYTGESTGDDVVLGTATYMLASATSAPEPASTLLFAVSGCVMTLGRRRNQRRS